MQTTLEEETEGRVGSILSPRALMSSISSIARSIGFETGTRRFLCLIECLTKCGPVFFRYGTNALCELSQAPIGTKSCLGLFPLWFIGNIRQMTQHRQRFFGDLDSPRRNYVGRFRPPRKPTFAKFLESIRLVDSKFRNDLTVEFDTCLG